MRTLCAIALLLPLSACSTGYWYDYFQSAQYDKCEKLPSAEDRRRCKADTDPDKDNYDKQREAAKTGLPQ